MRLQNSGVTEPKFTKFLPDVEGSSAVVMHQRCDPPIRYGMPLHRMKMRYANFRLFEPRICYQLRPYHDSSVSWTIAKSRSD